MEAPGLPFDRPEDPQDASEVEPEIELAGPGDGDGREIWPVGELLREVKGGLELTFPRVWVRGEISNFRDHASGHWYFSLKDPGGAMSMVMFRGDNARVPFDPEDGTEVIACGRLTLFEPMGRFQMIASLLEPVGAGSLQLRFEQLKRKLDAEGLFDEDRKRPLPRLPSTVGVVTSPSGAAWRDMTRVWRRRGVTARILLSPSRVQGKGAAAEIIDALQLLIEHGEAEVVIIGRGGGSREDLWEFNDEALARAIAACPVPVIAAVGHETDVSIADLVADRRAATPTAAAEVVSAARDELTATLVAIDRRCRGAMGARIQRARFALDSATLDRALRRPGQVLQGYQQRLDRTWERVDDLFREAHGSRAERLGRAGQALARHTPQALASSRRKAFESTMERATDALRERLHRGRERLGAVAARTEAMSPLAVLGRGYSLCHAPDGSLLRDANRVHRGDHVRVRLHHGEIDCAVEEIRVPESSGDHSV